MKAKLFKVLAIVMAMTMCLSLGMVAYADIDYDYDDDDEIFGDWDDGDDDGDEPYEEIYGYISIQMSDSNITQGESTNAYADIYTNASYYSVGVTWESSNTSVAQVQGSGNSVQIKGVGAGSATIVAALYIEGDRYDVDSVQLNVQQSQPTHIGVTGISLSTNSLTLNVGDRVTVGYTVLPDNASNKSIWVKSSDWDVVTVDNNGNVKAKKPGEAYLTFVTNDNGCRATVNIKVRGESMRDVPITAISVNPSQATMTVGQELYITPSCYPQDAKNKEVNYYSSNTTVATVTATGKVNAVGVGTAIITTSAKNGGAQVGTVITVVAGSQVAPEKKAAAPVVASATRSAEFNYQVLQKIAACPKNGTVNLNPPTPMSFHLTAATALKARPDVKVVCTFPFNGVKFRMTIPKGYDLASQMDKTGYVEWLQLCFKPGITIEAIGTAK